jgi:rhodanese-related sulfurtransferase
MWIIAVITLHAVVGIHAKELVLNHTANVQDVTDAIANKLVDRLVDKLLANMVQIGRVPQASRPAMRGHTLPSSFASPAFAPHVRRTVVPNAEMIAEGRPKVAKTQTSMGREWAANYRKLFKRGLKPLTPQEALKMTEARFFPAKLVDIRLESQFVTGHAKGAINLPLLQVVQGNSAFDWTKKLISYSVGVQPTESNPEFQAKAFEELKRNQPIIIVCDRGGTVENIVEDKKATEPKRYTASLKAASALYDAGFSNLFFLEGGLNQWEREGFPVEGDTSILAQFQNSIPNLGAVIWIPAQIPLYFALIAIAKNLGLVNVQ